jgi:uncharacterized protein (TIGR03435 family)
LDSWSSLALQTLITVKAQSPKAPAFDVASVKSNKSGIPQVGVEFAAGRFRATNATLRMLIKNAYSSPQPLADNRLIGGPKWLDSDHFDIVEKVDNIPPPGRNGPSPQLMLMLKTLLAERFRLVTHSERRELPVFFLTFAKRDQTLGQVE